MNNNFLWVRSYHKLVLPGLSYWPLVGSMSAFLITLGGIYWWHYSFKNMFLLGVVILGATMFLWWRDLMNEGLAGEQNMFFLHNIQLGVMMFIFSEVLFFASFFWGFFHMCWSPSEELGALWPPVNFKEIVMDPFSVPLLNTMILLSSGATVTACHFFLLISESVKKYNQGLFFLLVTVVLGVVFLILQVEEYASSYLSFNSTVYGSAFFILTGFHGLHVTMGAIALFVTLIRLFNRTLSVYDHIGFEASAWYWHFVDVVWLFLYIFVYWLGAPL